MFYMYRQHNTLWYQFCNFKHFLKAENSEDSLASLCVEFSIGLSCNHETGLLLEPDFYSSTLLVEKDEPGVVWA